VANSLQQTLKQKELLNVPKAVAVIGTLDTKGDQLEYLRQLIESRGLQACVMDVGVMGDPPFKPTIDHEQVARAAGLSLEAIITLDDPHAAMTKMAEGAAEIVKDLHTKGKLHGVLAVGGSMATALAVKVVKALPLGVPKLIITTVAHSASITPDLVGGDDVMMLPWVAGLWGLNSLSKRVLETAAGAISGAAGAFQREEIPQKKVVGVTSLGGTVNRYMSRLKPALEDRGHEVAVFHVTGMSGRVFEKAITDGLITFSLDLAVGVELVNEVAEGVGTAGKHRLEAAGKMGIPQIVSPGAFEAFHWGPDRPFPEKYRARPHHPHNDLLMVVRSSIEEMGSVGDLMARKLNMAKGPTAVVIPMGGIGQVPKPARPDRLSKDRQARAAFRDALSDISAEGLEAFREALMGRIKPKIKVITLDAAINDPPYAETVLKLFDEMR